MTFAQVVVWVVYLFKCEVTSGKVNMDVNIQMESEWSNPSKNLKTGVFESLCSTVLKKSPKHLQGYDFSPVDYSDKRQKKNEQE